MDLRIKTKKQVTELIDFLSKLLDNYQNFTVEDVFEVLNLDIKSSAHNRLYGWTTFNGIVINHDRKGYVVHFPEPSPIKEGM